MDEELKCRHYFQAWQKYCGAPGVAYPIGIRCDLHAPWGPKLPIGEINESVSAVSE